jgi:hypothetical protein
MNTIELDNFLYLAQSYKSMSMSVKDFFNINEKLLIHNCELYLWNCDIGYVRVYKEKLNFTHDVLWSPELPLNDRDKFDKILKLQTWW